MQALMENIVAQDDAAQGTEVLRILKAEDEALLKEPTKKLCSDFKKLRQAYYKEKYKEKKVDLD